MVPSKQFLTKSGRPVFLLECKDLEAARLERIKESAPNLFLNIEDDVRALHGLVSVMQGLAKEERHVKPLNDMRAILDDLSDSVFKLHEFLALPRDLQNSPEKSEK